MKHLGDITKISGYDAPTINVIIGGSPCQDLSVAGKRAGLSGERSGLFMEQIRIIKEMRDKDAKSGRTGTDIRPRFMVWENVPGAFSVNGGADFAAVLEETIRVAEPEAPHVDVPCNGWTDAGCFVGGCWSVAWRVLDAQYWGVPQRRRRIALVADFGGQSAPEILFKPKSMSGHFEPCGETRKRYPGDAENGIGDTGTYVLNDQGGQSMDVTINVTGTLRAQEHGHQPIVFGLSAYESNSMKSDNPNSGIYEADTSRTLDNNGGNPACNQGGMAVVYSIQGSMIGRADENGPQGDGINVDTCFTVNTTDRHAVVYENHAQDCRYDDVGDVAPTCTSRYGTGGGQHADSC